MRISDWSSDVCSSDLTDKNTSMILDERGIYRSQGEAPEQATPLFNEFLKDYIQKNRLKLDQNLRVEYDFYRQQMYICESLSRYDAIYEKAWVQIGRASCRERVCQYV